MPRDPSHGTKLLGLHDICVPAYTYILEMYVSLYARVLLYVYMCVCVRVKRGEEEDKEERKSALFSLNSPLA